MVAAFVAAWLTLMSVLVFVAYAPDDVQGSALGTITNATRKSLGLEDNAIGNGSLALHPDDAQVALMAQGNYIRAYRDSVSAPNLLGGFWVETGSDIVLSDDETGGELLQRGGRGSIAVLQEAIAWHKAVSGQPDQLQKAKKRWYWKNAHPARPLVRLLEEAQARGSLDGVTWDFTRYTDSDGNAWTSDYFDEWEIPIGMDLLTLVGSMRDAGLHITMDGDLVLHCWESYENDLSGSVDLTAGDNIRESGQRDIVARVAKSNILVQGTDKDDGEMYRVSWDDSIRTALGRRKEGYFSFPRTATHSILQRVGARKLRQWKKQYDGPVTVGIIDTTGRVAGVDFTVGDTVLLDIPGRIDSSAERVAGIMFSDSEDTGEYLPIIDLGDFAHDASGAYLGGDSSGLNPCGCAGPGGSSGGGGGSNGGTGTTGSTGGGGGGGSSVDVTEYLIDDFGDAGPALVSTETNGATATASHVIELPDGSDVPGRVIVLFVTSLDSAVDVKTAVQNAGFTYVDSDTDSTMEGLLFVRRVTGSEPWSGTGDVVNVTTASPVSLGFVAGLYENVFDSDNHLDYIKAVSAPATQDPPTTGAASFDGESQVTWFAWLNTNGLVVTTTPTGYTQPVGSYLQVVRSKDGVDGVEDPSTYVVTTGATRNIAWTVTLRGDSPGAMALPGPGVTGSPHDGGNLYVDESADPMDFVTGAGALVLTSDEFAKEFNRRLQSPPGVVWDGDNWTMRWRFELDEAGSLTDPGDRFMAMGYSEHGDAVVFRCYLGDADHAPGVGIVSGLSEEYAAKTITLDTEYWFEVGYFDGVAKARLYAASGSRPSTWDVSLSGLDDTVDSLGLNIAIYLGNNGGTAQNLTIHEWRGGKTSTPGAYVSDVLVARGDGYTVTFSLPDGDRFASGSLVVKVDNAIVLPAATNPAAGTFTLGTAPYGDPADALAGAVIRASYTRA